MNRRQRAAKAARVACHNAKADNRKRWNVSVSIDGGPSEPFPFRAPSAPNDRGRLIHKASPAKVRRLIARASRKANRG